jgi:hypothetical protein
MRLRHSYTSHDVFPAFIANRHVSVADSRAALTECMPLSITYVLDFNFSVVGSAAVISCHVCSSTILPFAPFSCCARWIVWSAFFLVRSPSHIARMVLTPQNGRM